MIITSTILTSTLIIAFLTVTKLIGIVLKITPQEIFTTPFFFSCASILAVVFSLPLILLYLLILAVVNTVI